MIYLDSSAVLKLVRRSRERRARGLAGRPGIHSCDRLPSLRPSGATTTLRAELHCGGIDRGAAPCRRARRATCGRVAAMHGSSAACDACTWTASLPSTPDLEPSSPTTPGSSPRSSAICGLRLAARPGSGSSRRQACARRTAAGASAPARRLAGCHSALERPGRPRQAPRPHPGVFTSPVSPCGGPGGSRPGRRSG